MKQRQHRRLCVDGSCSFCYSWRPLSSVILPLVCAPPELLLEVCLVMTYFQLLSGSTIENTLLLYLLKKYYWGYCLWYHTVPWYKISTEKFPVESVVKINLLPNQTWFCLPTGSKTNLLTEGYGEGWRKVQDLLQSAK